MKNIKLEMPGLAGRSIERGAVARIKAIALVSLSLLVAPTTAFSSIVLNFEGIDDNTGVGNYYILDGVTFSAGATAFIDSDVLPPGTGTGNFENEPSPSTVMTLIGVNSVTLNFSSGFTDVKFWFAALNDGSYSIFDGVGGTGAVVGSGDLFANSIGCDSSPAFCFFEEITAGGFIGRSIVFDGQAELFAFDDIELEPAPVPLPAAAWLLLSGLAGLGFVGRRRTAK